MENSKGSEFFMSFGVLKSKPEFWDSSSSHKRVRWKLVGQREI